MIMSFAQPLGVGVTSDGEYLDIELQEEIDPQDAVRRLNEVSVEGIEVVNFCRIPDDKKSSGMTIVAAAGYRAVLLESAKSADIPRAFPESWKEKMTEFLRQDSIVVLKRTKRSEAQTDIKPLIYQMRLEENGIYLFLAAGSEQNLKPDLVIKAFLDFIGEDPDSVPFHYHRIDVYARDIRKLQDAMAFVPLDQV